MGFEDLKYLPRPAMSHSKDLQGIRIRSLHGTDPSGPQAFQTSPKRLGVKSGVQCYILLKVGTVGREFDGKFEAHSKRQ